MSKKYNRSSRAPESELKVTCPIEGCGRRFINKQGISVHLWKTHGVSQKKSYVLSPGQTICDNCKVDFGSEKSLQAHGGPEVCKARKDKNYLKFNCGTCGKVSERYIHPSRRGEIQLITNREPQVPVQTYTSNRGLQLAHIGE